eukprot:15355391-Ditylum_brightwellii.AAC.1
MERDQPNRIASDNSPTNSADPSHDMVSVNDNCHDKQMDINSDVEDLSILLLDAFSIASDGSDSVEWNEQVKLIHDGTTKIYCVKDSKNTFGGCSGSVAMKSLADEFPDEEEVFRLKNEYAISKYLSKCSAIRAALAERCMDGVKAIVLDWANGITLEDWICLNRKKEHSSSLTINTSTYCQSFCESDLKMILQLAWSISNALSDIHDAGVALNNLNPENIIIDDKDDNVVVKIIGLGYASLLTDDKKKIEDFIPQTRKDIQHLGIILFKIFTGQSPLYRKSHLDSMDGGKSDMRLQSQNQLVYMLTSKVPLSFAELAIGLMKADGSALDSWSARTVERELNSMIRDLGSILSNAEKQPILGTSNASKIAIVSGCSGVGKSSLVKHTKQFIKKKDVCFISGKFDQFQQMEPLSTIHAAFTEYTNNILRKGPENIHQTREAIIKAINTDIGVLTETFVRVVATPSYPIIIFLDDLQWADELSLDLISTLVADTENPNFLFIGACRDDEADGNHPLMKHLNDLKRKNVDITSINVTSILKTDTNELISDVISLPPQLTKSFSRTVYQKTSGNVLLVIQFLQSLCDEGLLLFSLESNTWQWDAQAIEAKEIPDDVGLMMSKKILQLP